MAKALEELVDPGWLPILEPERDNLAALGEFLRAEGVDGRSWLPAGDHILRWTTCGS